LTVHRTELTPVSFLRRSAMVHADRTAVVHGERRYTYRELGERAERLASALRAAGLERGDRVVFLCPNIPALLEAHFGVPAAGGVLVTINYRLTAAEVAHILGHSGARFAFVDRELESLLDGADSGAVHRVRIEDSGAAGDPYEDFLAGGSPQPPERVPIADEEETIAIDYTSGTTGKPKGVMYSHRGAYLNALSAALSVGLGAHSAFLWTLPMFHCNGWCFTWAVTATGACHVCLRSVEAERIWALFEAEGVTHYNAAPTVQTAIASDARAHRLDREVLTAIGGAPPSPALLGRLAELNIRPIHLYGLTETYGPATICERKDSWEGLAVGELAELLGRQGLHHVTADPVRVVGDDGSEVPADGRALGEVLMRGNTVMKGYFDDPDATAAAFAGGWFHSGDLAVRHPDGYIEIRDRKKDIVISGGENVSTVEVEHAVARHPAVAEAAVVAVPDERWGERPKAFVELRDGEAASEEDILEFCRGELAGFKRPAAVELCELPKTSTGKVQKHVLREREWAGRERRVN
jgi:fatty-acyl-CoA synthase